MFLGDQSVGKTSIITRFMYDKFDNTYQVFCVCMCVCLQLCCLCACLLDSHLCAVCRLQSALTSSPRLCTLKTVLCDCNSGKAACLLFALGHLQCSVFSRRPSSQHSQGHCWAGEVPQFNTQLHPGLFGGRGCLRCH